MREIESGWRNALEKRMQFWSLLIIAGGLMIALALMGNGAWNWKMIMAVFLIILTVTALRRFFISRKYIRSQIRRCFGSDTDADLFFREIDAELKDEDCIRLTEEIYRLHLFLTKTWFVFISANGSIIRKRKEIVSVTSDFRPSDSEHVLNVKFADGSSFINSCDAVCDEIISLMNDFLRKGSEEYEIR